MLGVYRFPTPVPIAVLTCAVYVTRHSRLGDFSAVCLVIKITIAERNPDTQRSKQQTFGFSPRLLAGIDSKMPLMTLSI